MGGVEAAMATMWVGVPDLDSLRKIIDYFGKESASEEEAVAKAEEYVKDRAFCADGIKVNPNDKFRAAVREKFTEYHKA